MYIPQLLNSFVRRLLGNGKWCQLRLHFQTSVTLFIRVFSKLWRQVMKGEISVYLKKGGLEESTVVFLEIV